MLFHSLQFAIFFAALLLALRTLPPRARNPLLLGASGLFYLVDWYGDDLYEIAADGSAILNQVTVGSSLWQLVVAPDGQEIYLTDPSGIWV